MPLHAACLACRPAPEGLRRLYAFDQGAFEHGLTLGLLSPSIAATLVTFTPDGDSQRVWEGAQAENAIAVGSPCGRLVALATVGAVEVFDLTTRQRRHRLPLPTAQAVTSRLRWDTPNRLIVITADASVSVWRPHDGTLLAAWTAAVGEDVTTASTALPDDPPIFTEQRRGPEGWVGRLCRADDGSVVREVCVPSIHSAAPFVATDLTVGRGTLDLAASLTWDEGDMRRSALHLWRGGQHILLGELTCEEGPDEPQPIWDVQIVTPGLVFTQGWAGCRVWDVETQTSRAVPKPAGWSRDGLMLGRDDTVTDLKTGDVASLGEGRARARAISPDGRLVLLCRGEALEWWHLSR